MSNHDHQLCEDCLQKEYESFRHTCVRESITQNDVLTEKYRMGHWPRWDYSMENATLIFSDQGKPKVVCDIEVVGSTTLQSWEWSWGNANFPDSCRSRMAALREFGEQKEWERLTTLFLESDEYVGWECASVASHILGGLGVYRCPNSGGTERDAVFVVILSAHFVN
jgi:hypothetical protein